MRRMREVTVTMPVEVAQAEGMAYSLWLPDGPPRGGVVILHGAASSKESHHDFCRLLVSGGFGALAFDQRGHGASPGPLGASAIDDIAAMATLLREQIGGPGAAIALRGSSMGGYLSLVAAARVQARAVIAVCPASDEGLRRGLHRGTLGFAADVPALDAVLGEHPV